MPETVDLVLGILISKVSGRGIWFWLSDCKGCDGDWGNQPLKVAPFSTISWDFHRFRGLLDRNCFALFPMGIVGIEYGMVD